MDELMQCTTSTVRYPERRSHLVYVAGYCTVLVSFMKRRRGIVILSYVSQYKFAM